MAESKNTATDKNAPVPASNDPMADEKHVAKAAAGTVDPNAGRQAKAVSEIRAEEAQLEQFGAQQTAAEQKAENAKIKLVSPAKGGVAYGATGAPIQEGGSGVHGGVI